MVSSSLGSERIPTLSLWSDTKKKEVRISVCALDFKVDLTQMNSSDPSTQEWQASPHLFDFGCKGTDF